MPELTRAGDPATQIAELESATGRDLPDDFGQLTVFESDRLAEAQASVQNAQRAVALLKRATWVLAALAVVFLVATVLLARNRLRAGLWLALGCIVGMVLSRTVVHRVVDDAPSLVPGAAGRAAIADILGQATTRLAAPHRVDRHHRRPRRRVDAVPARLDRQRPAPRRRRRARAWRLSPCSASASGRVLLGVVLAVAAVVIVPRAGRVTTSGGADHLTSCAARECVRP